MLFPVGDLTSAPASNPCPPPPHQRGESTPLILKSAAVETLTSEGATILLGVLLADMTGTMLRLQGVHGGGGSCYYPASFVNEVLT